MVYVDAKSCDGCGLCVEACPNGALKVVQGVAVVDSTLCRETGTCLEACPQGALLQVEEPTEEGSHPAPVHAAPLVKRASASVAKPSASIGAWMGAALAYLVSDVAPQALRYWLERRRQPSSFTPLNSGSIGRGRRNGTGKLRRRRRKGRRA